MPVPSVAYGIESYNDRYPGSANALNVARRSIGNQALVDAVSNSIERVKEGKQLGPSLAECRTLFSGSVLEMISVAEESGRLDQELVRIANVTEGDLDRQLKGIDARDQISVDSVGSSGWRPRREAR